MNLKLAQKGFILVLVPLIFEVIFVVTLNDLIDHLQKEIDEQIRATTMAAEAVELGKQFTDLGMSLIAGNFLHEGQMSHAMLGRVQALRAKLDQLPLRRDYNPLEMEHVRRICILGLQELEVIETVQQKVSLMSAGDSKPVAGLLSPIASLSSSQLRERSEALVNPLTKELADLAALERTVSTDKEAQASKTRSMIRPFVWFGVAASVLIAGLLAHFFNNQILKRVIHLQDNTRRMAGDQSIQPSMHGADELSDLDRSFVSMAAAVQTAQRQERAIAANVLDIILSLSPDYAIVRANPAVRTLLSYEPSDLQGKNILDFVSAGDVEKTRQALKRARAGEQVADLENSLRRGDKQSMEAAWTISWSEPDGAFFCVLHDVTQRRQMERLRQEFVAMVSHDLRTPLTSIQCTLDMVGDGVYGAVPDAVNTQLSKALQTSEWLISLINELLDMEKLEAGQMQIQTRPCSLDAIISKAVSSVTAFAESNDKKVLAGSCDIDVCADPDRIVQVIVNLISNAIKFSPAGETVRVEAEIVENQAEVRVIDNGKGVPKKMQSLIFERFKQVDLEDATVRGGTGLGLAICKTMIDLHNGTIGVRSQPGSGSTFWLRLPLAPDE